MKNAMNLRWSALLAATVLALPLTGCADAEGDESDNVQALGQAESDGGDNVQAVEQAVSATCDASLLCCNTVTNANTPPVSLLLGLLGIVNVPPGEVGVTCTPISGGTCNQTPACCTNNSFNGLVALGCTRP